MRSKWIAGLVMVMASSAMALGQAWDEKHIAKELKNADLFRAITLHDANGVKAALANGSGPNDRNWLNFTPLMWAAMRGDKAVVDVILKAGANLADTAIYGNSVTIAECGRQEDIALYLISKGAKPDVKRVDGANALMFAAANGHVKLVDKLIALKVNVNTPDTDGATALTWASRQGQTKSIARLLKAGAKVDALDSLGRTALMHAAAANHSNAVAALIAAGAKVNTVDKTGTTALLLAARYNGNAASISSLLKAGASASAKDKTKKTALQLATAREYSDAVRLLKPVTKSASLQVAYAGAPTPKASIQKSLTLLESSLRTFGKRAKCGSCHQQGLGLMALGAGAKAGFKVDQALIGQALKALAEQEADRGPVLAQIPQHPEYAKLAPAFDIGDFAIGGGYLFSGMHAAGVPANPELAGPAMLLAMNQEKDGRWSFGPDREPMQSSDATVTALVLNVINAYAPKEAVPMLEGVKARSRAWLASFKPKSTEDAAARLWAAKNAGCSADELANYSGDLLALQRKDGGWAQLPSMGSDAHATGISLYALAVAAGLDQKHADVQRAIKYLLRTQDEDGSWFVNKRCMPANTYFDAGYPHGQSQYASYAGASWATLGLIATTAEANRTALK